MSVNEKMTAIADAIRGKTGGTEPLTLDQMATEIEGIKAGEEILYSTGGRMYVENVIVPETVTTLFEGVYNIIGIKSIYAPEVTTLAGHYSLGGHGNIIETIICPKLVNWPTTHWCFRGQAIKTIQAGSIGYPVVTMPNKNGFVTDCAPEITIYVDAKAIGEITENITKYAPFGAFNATIIYRNSTTGEVITE